MDIFIDKEKRNYLKLNIYYCHYKTDNDQENLLFFSKKEYANQYIHEKLKKIEVKMLIPTFEEYMDITKKSIIQLTNGGAIVHDFAYQQQVLKVLLKKIITDDYEVDITEENYGTIHPLLGDAIFKAFKEAFINPDLKIEDVF